MMVKRYLYTLVCLLFSDGIMYAMQETDSLAVLKYGDKILVRISTDSRTEQFRYTSLEPDGTTLLLQPNVDYHIFLSVDYDMLGFSVNLKPGLIRGDDDQGRKGRTGVKEYRFRFLPGSWMQQLHYSNIRGYYVSNTSDFVPDWDSERDPFLLLPDLEHRSLGGSTAYFLNKDYSLKTLFTQSEWQQQSSGSFAVSIRYLLERLFIEDEDLRVVEKSLDLRWSMAYFYTWVIGRHWNVSPYLTAGLGFRLSRGEEKQSGLSEQDREESFGSTLDGGLQLGYSSKRFFAGANINVISDRYRDDVRTRVQLQQVYGLFYLGYRFDAPLFLVRATEKVKGMVNGS